MLSRQSATAKRLTAAGGERIWPRAAVFDCDGLLIESEHAWHAAYAAVLARRSRTLSDEAKQSLNGASVPSAARRLGVPETELRRELGAAFEALPVPARPGVGQLLDSLAEAAIPLAVATNGPEALARDALSRIGIRDYFQAVVSAERTGHYKPLPAVYLEACAALSVDPSDAVALEDSVAGATAARRASMLVICVPTLAAVEIDADLRVSRLDHPAVFSQFGLERPRSADGRPMPIPDEARS